MKFANLLFHFIYFWETYFIDIFSSIILLYVTILRKHTKKCREFSRRHYHLRGRMRRSSGKKWGGGRDGKLELGAISLPRVAHRFDSVYIGNRGTDNVQSRMLLNSLFRISLSFYCYQKIWRSKTLHEAILHGLFRADFAINWRTDGNYRWCGLIYKI